MFTSTLTSKGQVTIPSEVRKNLDLHAGDKVVFEIIDQQVIIRKLTPFDHVCHAGLAATLTEWDSAEDNEAYRGL
jgi:antitoxin PrlF